MGVCKMAPICWSIKMTLVGSENKKGCGWEMVPGLARQRESGTMAPTSLPTHRISQKAPAPRTNILCKVERASLFHIKSGHFSKCCFSSGPWGRWVCALPFRAIPQFIPSPIGLQGYESYGSSKLDVLGLISRNSPILNVEVPDVLLLIYLIWRGCFASFLVFFRGNYSTYGCRFSVSLGKNEFRILLGHHLELELLLFSILVEHLKLRFHTSSNFIHLRSLFIYCLQYGICCCNYLYILLLNFGILVILLYPTHFLF